MNSFMIFVAVANFAWSQFAIRNLDENEWTRFKSKHNKSYMNLTEERDRRNSYFENKILTESHNKLYERGYFPFGLGLNKYADLPFTEFNVRMNNLRLMPRVGMNLSLLRELNEFNAPNEIDWRTNNVSIITPVKDQRQCGSCWAFSATGSLEGQHAMKTGRLVSLSEQNLMDCSRDKINQGCNGGVQDEAFRYIKMNKGIDTEESYPYQGRDGLSCRFNATNVGATDNGFQDIPRGSEEVLKKAVAKVGPIAVGMDASGFPFQFYRQGIYYNPLCSSTKLNHGVLVVGYGREGDLDYWIVKNSYGESWGDEGYFRIVRNLGNHCGIATQASFPLV